MPCLYEINLIYQDNADEPEILLNKIVQHIPQAFQYPAAASAVINIGEEEYISDRLQRTGNYLTAEILYNTEPVGSLTVFYPDNFSNSEPMHFLPEEQKLLDIIAQKVALIYEKLTYQQHRDAMEVQLRHADRLATIGQLASGIAHELNDPLANILGYAQLLKKTTLNTAQAADLDRIVRSSLHAREIVRKLLLFARQMPTQKSGISLNKIILDTLDLLKSRLEQWNVSVITDLQPDLPELTADPSQMTQVITNLCVNALQAMPEGGSLHLTTSVQKKSICLEVTDTGTGMDAETRSKIFLPFFTTKPVGIGTGLGLSVVHGIITSHHGKIDVFSEPGKGSRFVVTLPV
jgi:signal transduction histidine kinase